MYTLFLHHGLGFQQSGGIGNPWKTICVCYDDCDKLCHNRLQEVPFVLVMEWASHVILISEQSLGGISNQTCLWRRRCSVSNEWLKAVKFKFYIWRQKQKQELCTILTDLMVYQCGMVFCRFEDALVWLNFHWILVVPIKASTLSIIILIAIDQLSFCPTIM